MKEKVVSPAEYLVRTAIRVEVHAKNASGIGTGFFMKIPLDNQRFIPVIVSNRHLLAADNVQKYVLCFYEINEKSDRVGMRKIETTPFESPLSTHSDPNCDLAAINITSILNRNDGKIDFVPVDPKWIPNKWELLDAIEDLIMIGYPGDIYLKTDDPVVRRGISATPIGSKFEGGEKFLADIPVFSGSSGSPIFIFNPTGGFSRNEDGSWAGPEGNSDWYGSTRNPIGPTEVNSSETKGYNLLANLTAELTFTKWLKFKSTFGYDAKFWFIDNWTPAYDWAPTPTEDSSRY